MANLLAIRVHEGVEIKMMDNFRFLIDDEKFIPADDSGFNGRWFDCVDVAQQAMDDGHAAEALANLRYVSFSPNVLDKTGKPMTFRGLNRKNREALISTNEGGNGSYSGMIYPDLPWVRDALVELN